MIFNKYSVNNDGTIVLFTLIEEKIYDLTKKQLSTKGKLHLSIEIGKQDKDISYIIMNVALTEEDTKKLLYEDERFSIMELIKKKAYRFHDNDVDRSYLSKISDFIDSSIKDECAILYPMLCLV